MAHDLCTVMRRKLVTHSTLNMLTGAMSAPKRQVWETSPCATPLFNDDQRAAGVCKSCAGGWTHEHNFAVGPDALVDETIDVDGTNWKVRYADNRAAALSEIAHARVTGSVGGSTTVNGRQVSDVVRLDADGNEVKPS